MSVTSQSCISLQSAALQVVSFMEAEWVGLLQHNCGMAVHGCPPCYLECIVLPHLCNLNQELQIFQLFDSCKFWQK